MRLRRLAAVTLGMAMALSMTAYANDADAVAVFQEMEAKCNAMSDMDAYLDFKIDMSDGADHIGMRMESNVKANNMTDPALMKVNTYMRMTFTDVTLGSTAEGPGGAGSSVDLTGTEMTSNVYYADGMQYMDSMGTKTKMEMPLDQMIASVKSQATGLISSVDYMNDMKLRTEGTDRIVSYTMDASKMNEMVGQIMGTSGLDTLMQGMGASFSYRDISGEYVINQEGYCTKARMKMAMDVSITSEGETETVTATLEGDVGYADPGQPVTVTAPNLAEYVDINTLAEQQQ